jgi:uncharacterized protein with FMN-binding domain
VSDGNKGNKKIANGLVALSSVAVIAVYGAGYARTRAAADRFEHEAADRRPHIPTPRGDEGAPRGHALTANNSVAATPPSIEHERAPVADDAQLHNASPQPHAASTPAAKPADASAARAASGPAPAAEATSAPAVTPSTAADEQPATAATQSPTPAPVPAPAPPAVAAAAFKDGTYYGWGSCRHGDIEAAVVIEAGRITSARVERCLTRYSCNWVEPIPPRILLKQGTTYDYVSGATESSDAFQDAVAEALSKAKP